MKVVIIDTGSSNILSFNNPSSSIYFSGYYRFLGFVRNQQETFPNNSGKTVVISSGDAYREPMFLLKISSLKPEDMLFELLFRPSLNLSKIPILNINCNFLNF